MNFTIRVCLGFVKDFEDLPNDLERWTWVVNHQNLGITVMLDNDDTFATFDCQSGSDEPAVLQFDDYIGNKGVNHLLDFIGVKYEEV